MSLEAGEQTKKKATLEELAALVGGQVAGNPLLEVTGIVGLEEAGEGEITFLAELKNLPRLEKTKAAAAIVPLSLSAFSKPVIRTPNPYLAYAKNQAFFTHQPYRPRGVDPRAYLGQGRESVKKFPSTLSSSLGMDVRSGTVSSYTRGFTWENRRRLGKKASSIPTWWSWIDVSSERGPSSTPGPSSAAMGLGSLGMEPSM